MKGTTMKGTSDGTMKDTSDGTIRGIGDGTRPPVSQGVDAWSMVSACYKLCGSTEGGLTQAEKISS